MAIYDADPYRRRLSQVMQEAGLNPHSWAKKAGIRDGTIRNFLNGSTSSLTVESLAKLAAAAEMPMASLLIEQGGEIDEALLTETVETVLAMLKERGLQSPPWTTAQLVVHVYMVMSGVEASARQNEMRALAGNVVDFAGRAMKRA